MRPTTKSHKKNVKSKKKWKFNKSLPLTWFSNLTFNSYNKSNSTSHIDVILTKSKKLICGINGHFFVDEYHLVHIVHLETTLWTAIRMATIEKIRYVSIWLVEMPKICHVNIAMV